MDKAREKLAWATARLDAWDTWVMRIQAAAQHYVRTHPGSASDMRPAIEQAFDWAASTVPHPEEE